MKILLPKSVTEQLTSALRQADKQEIGGILMGEHIDTDTFQVKAVTIQTHGGTFLAFKRVVQNFLAPLRRFFRETGHNYTRFNYLGEWHSHPSFSPYPSSIDSETMRELVHDPQVGANFAVLLILTLTDANQLDGTVTVYLPEYRSVRGELIQESNGL